MKSMTRKIKSVRASIRGGRLIDLTWAVKPIWGGALFSVLVNINFGEGEGEQVFRRKRKRSSRAVVFENEKSLYGNLVGWVKWSMLAFAFAFASASASASILSSSRGHGGSPSFHFFS